MVKSYFKVMSLLLVLQGLLLAGSQDLFEGNFSASRWESTANFEVAPSESGLGIKSAWALSPKVTYGWIRMKVSGLDGKASLFKVKLKGEIPSGVEIILASLGTDKKKKTEVYFRHPQLASASKDGKETIYKLSEFMNDDKNTAMKQEQFATINYVMFKAKGKTPFTLYVEEIATGSDSDFTVQESKSLISEKKLFTLLDPNRKEYQAALQAEKAGDHQKAIHLLADYFRNRTSPPWLFDPHTIDKTVTFDEKSAKNAVSATFSHVKATYTYPNGVINWTYNPTIGKPYATAEWVFNLNRMGHWGQLGNAYWATGDKIYAQAFVQQMLSYYNTQPCPEVQNENVGSTWRELEVGQRIQISWLNAYHRFLHAPEMTDEVLLTMLRSMLEQGQLLRNCPPEPGNHHLIGMNGLYVLGCMFPEFPMTKDWRAYAMQEMTIPFNNPKEGWLADGMWYERAPGYHQWLVGKNLLIAKTAKQTGVLSELPEAFFSGLKKSAEFNIRMVSPDMTVPAVNDAKNEDQMKCNLEDYLYLFPDSSIFKWLRDVQSNLSPAAPAELGSQYLSSSGYVIMRSGLSRKDSYALFDTGDLGGWHGHKDKLNIVLYLEGREVLYDNGGGDYDISPLRRYSISTKSHNTVMVDGKNQFRPYTEEDPAGTDRAETPRVKVNFTKAQDSSTAWFVGSYTENDVQDKVNKEEPLFKHRREIVFLKPKTMVVVDTLFPPDNASHEYQQRWHNRSPEWKLGEDKYSIYSGKEVSSAFLILPVSRAGLKVSGHVGEKTPELIGWDVGHGEEAKPALTVIHEKSGTGVQRFVTLLTLAGEGSGSARVTELSKDSWKVDVAGMTYQIQSAENYQDGLTVEVK